MSLYDKIKTIYPELTDMDFYFLGGGSIQLQNDADSNGDYIAKWEHPVYPRPTDEQLAALEA